MTAQRVLSFLLQGGLDLVTPRAAARPGSLLACQNYESFERGYRRVDGFERFDGQPAPSDATYHYVIFDAGDDAITAGQSITFVGSAATGIAVDDATVLTGSYGANDATGYIGVYITSGTPADNDAMQVGGVTKLTVNGTPVERGAPTDEIDAALLQAEMERRRALIAVPPTGSGSVTGVFSLAGEVFCFRNHTGGTFTQLYRESVGGWDEVSLGETVDFTLGTADYNEGETLTRGGVTSTIVRVVVQSGTWGGGTAAGYVVIKNRAGGNYTAGVATTASGSATLSGAQTAITINPNIVLRWISHSFTGVASDERIYGATNQDYAFEFDGEEYGYVPIRVPGLAVGADRPVRIAVFHNHLFLSYRSGTTMFSEIGVPLQFTAAGGAGEFNFGERINALVNANTSLVAFGNTSVGFLTGTDADTFVLSMISETAGCQVFGACMADEPVFLDDTGIRRLSTTASFGDWKMGSLTEAASPFFETKILAGTGTRGTIPVKRKNQVRIYFDDGSYASVYLGRKYPEVTTGNLGDVVPNVVSVCPDANNFDRVFIGATNGYVYQIDKGSNYDGEEVAAYIVPHFVSPDGNMHNKRWHSVTIECDAATTAQEAVQFRAEYSYGDGGGVPSIESDGTITGVGGFWDILEWDNFIWDAPVQGWASGTLNGYGFNVSVPISSELTYEDPHTLSSMSITYSQRGMIRR